MESIRSYLESMFSGLGTSPKVLKAKEELLSMMEDKYHELKAEGLSENEAVGQVITEFGNLNEVSESLGISENVEGLPLVTLSESKTVVERYQIFFPKIAWGVLAIILSTVSLFVSIAIVEHSPETLSENVASGIGLFTIITVVSLAVLTFITASTGVSEFEYIREEPFKLEDSAKIYITDLEKQDRPNYQRSLGLSVVLFILSAIPLIMSDIIDSNLFIYLSMALLLVFLILFKNIKLLMVYVPLLVVYGFIIYYFDFAIATRSTVALGLTIIMVAAGVFNLIYNNAINHAAPMLLQKDDFSLKSKKKDLSQIVTQVYWSLAVIIYLLWSFLTNDWHISWIVWPIASVLYGLIASIIDYKENRRS